MDTKYSLDSLDRQKTLHCTYFYSLTFCYFLSLEALKQKQTLLGRIQKKLILVAKERDCYKQVIEHYEKETTSELSAALTSFTSI